MNTKHLKTILLLLNTSLVFFLILLNNLGIIPLRTGDFIFFTFLAFALALYRPGWMFLFFIGTIPLENINLAPASFGISIRPYQLLGSLIILAVIIRWLSGKLNFKLAKLKWPDYLVIIMAISGLISALAHPNSLKLSLIIISFAAFYFLTRIYIQSTDDLKKIVPFFLTSSLVVILYGIWQNIWFMRGLNGFEVMPGRPNATFTEADWLGIFLVLLISVLYVLIYNFQKSKIKIQKIFLLIILILSYILLILTVSRSAWLGAFISLVVFLFAIFTNLKISFKNLEWKKTIKIKLTIIPALIIAVGLVYVFNLTNFQLGNRVQSTGSGMQKITISCEERIDLPENIKNVTELNQYNCRHINLEEIDSEKSNEKYVAEIYRNDPNVSIRGEIYQKSWQEIKQHPILGIGWGSIGNILGKDGRGTDLNSSNIFLEVWLGSGILGFASFVILLAYILIKGIKEFYLAQNSSQRIFGLFIIVSWFAIIIPNLFNAGIMLGFLWVWIAVVFTKINKV